MDTKYNIVNEQGLSGFVDKITTMQKDLDYLIQFVVNVPALFRGKKPTILVHAGTREVEDLCGVCWRECVNAYQKIGDFSNGKERE